MKQEKNNALSWPLTEKVRVSDFVTDSAGSRQESDPPRCNKFKVVHLCTLDRGGAGKAAYRLHKGLRSIGVDSTMLVFDKRTSDPTVKVLPADCSDGLVSCLERSDMNSSLWKRIWHRWVRFADSLANKPKGFDLFSDTVSHVKFGTVREIQEADVVHLHWVAGLMDYAGGEAALGAKSVVWTLHDMNPFTGGCHYAGQCKKYTTSCGACPQLGSAGANDISSEIWKEKYDSYQNLQMQIVTPSRWLAGCAKQSALFGRLDVKVIPNGFPLGVFKPHPKQKIRQALNVSKFSKIILFTADAVGNERKGFKYLLEALECLGQRQSENDIALAVIGQSKDQPGLTKFPLIKFGQIRDETQMAMAYSVADIFVIPSLEDNLPNTVVEALACGVPVVGSNVGGIPDMVEHKKTGFLFEPGNVDELLAGIKWGLSIDSEYDQMSRRCRETAVGRYSLQKQAQAYCRLYENLLESNKLQVASPSRSQVSVSLGLPSTLAEPALPKISIVTPSFNQADYLEACIRSVLDQDYPNLEYIIIDGGSTDGSVEIIEKYADRLAYWVSEPDGGHVDGLNKGFKHSTGEIMGWLNSDDMLHPGALSIVAEVLGQNEEIEWLMGAPTTWDSTGRTVIANHPELWNRARFLSYDYKWIQQESTYWKRPLWQRAGGYVDDKFKLAADLELWVRFFRCARLFSISGLIGGFRTHGRQKTAWGLDKYLQEADAIILKEIELVLNGRCRYMPPKPGLIYYEGPQKGFRIRQGPNQKDLDENEKVAALSKAGQELAQAGKPQQALQHFLQLILLRPNQAQLYSIIGNLYSLIGRDTAAKMVFEKAVKLDTSDTKARQKLQELGAAKKNLPHNYLASVSWNEPADARPRHRRVTAENFSNFTYSKWSHIPYFRDGKILGKDSSLKVYQDCLPYTFILDNLPPGAKILEVGGGNSRVIDALKDRYEFWNVDKLEGLGNGPKDVQVDGFRLVRDYMGNFNKELPDNYFDLVFSISTLEHVPEDEQTFRNVCLDIDRVMKPGGFSVHCFDIIMQKAGVWTNRLLPYMFELFKTVHPFIPLPELYKDSDIWFMSEKGYKRHWANVAAKRSYEEHGKPMSYNILWKKLPDNSHIRDTAAAAGPQAQIARAIASSSSVSKQVCVSHDQAGSEPKYLVSAIVSTYNAERFITECLEDLEGQTIADKLEIVVVNSGSQQDEEAIVKQFQQRYDNIKYIKTERRESVYQAWNRGIKASSGKYITNANTDDRHRPDALEVMVKALEENPDKVLAYAHYNGVQLIDGRRSFYYNSPTKPYSYEALLGGNCLVGPQPMWRRDVHEEFGYFDEGFIVAADYEFWLRIAQGYDLLYIDETLGEFLESAESVSHVDDKSISCFDSIVIQKSYRYARNNAITIGKEGISGNKSPAICGWYGINLWKRKFAEKFGEGPAEPIEKIHDFRSMDKRPLLSVIVVTYNGKEKLLENLDVLQNQTEKNFEIIIVDNGEGLGQFTQANHTLAFELCYIKMSENLGPAFGRNTAAEFAKAPLVAFIDDDAIPDNDWVEKILANFKTRPICGLRGRISPNNENQDVPDYYDLGAKSIPSMCEVPGNSAFRKDIFLKLGGFDTTLFVHEAAELSYRIYDLLDYSPRGVMYAPDVHVRHQPCDQDNANYLDDKTSNEVLQGLTGTRYWRMKSYVNSMRALYPHGQWDFEDKFVDVLNISVILEKDFPELAIPWAQKALQMEPESVKACYMLGSSLLQTGREAEAEKFLERAVAMLARSIVSKPREMNDEELESYNRTLACYISTCTELGQCYTHKAEYGKVKTVYLGLLNNSYTPLTPEQRARFDELLEKMANVSVQPILPSQHYEHKLPSLLAVSFILMENCPASAVKWAERAVQIEPFTIKSCFTLGSLYTQLKVFDKAIPVLERTLTLLAADLQAFYSDNSQTGRENWANTVACYISAATKLAQCFVQVGRPGKMKTVYSHLLSNPYLQLTPDQSSSFQNVLAKLGDVEAVAIGDGMEDVPPEAFKDKSDEGPEEPATSRPDEAPVGRSDGRFLVSAIVSTYNSERFLAGCLEDLERQTIADKLEVIVVDSGSEQNEEAIVRRYQQQYDNIVYIKTEQREGLYAAWNRAIKVARGTFLTNANTDDRHRTDALEIMAKTLMSNPEVGLVYADQIFTETENAAFEDPHATEMHKWPAYSQERLLLGCCVGSQPMWRKSLHTKLGCFDESLTSAGDWDFWIRASGQYKFKRIPDFLGVYYHNKQGLEHGRKIHSLYERYIVGKRYGTEYIATIPLFKGDDYPLVSVIMPAFNAEDYIGQAIESALIQNYRNFELIVVDDGSTDQTGQIVQGFEDEKIAYLHKENAGASSARNLGIKNSKGEFIVVLDSDDMIQPDYIINHLKEFEKHPDADLIYCDHGLIDPQGAPIRAIEQPEYEDRRHLIRDMFRCGYPIIQPRGCFRRTVIDKIGLYDEDLAVGEDYDLMRRFIKQGLKAYRLKGPMYLRRMHGQSLCKTNTLQKAESHFSVIKRVIDTFGPDELFPDVQWSRIPQDKIAQHAKCLIAATLLAIAQNYQTTNEPVNVKLALEQARTVLDECLKIDPDNGRARQLLGQCELLGQSLDRAQVVNAAAN